jgi:heme/copper-type cytochrome/quinol oxidase subunit 1
MLEANRKAPSVWQHLFWIFGHPELYIIFLPGTGMVSEIVATFSRRPAFGYLLLVLSLIATTFLAFGLWVHHMFVTGLPQLGAALFTASSALIAVPNGIQIFCWIATIWGGKPVFRTPMLLVIGFIAIFVIGGLSGVMVASVRIDSQVHDTYFVVAHFHYVLIGGAVFPLIGGVYYWFPKFSGRMLRELVEPDPAGIDRIGIDAPRHALEPQDMHGKEGEVEADESEQEIPLPEALGQARRLHHWRCRRNACRSGGP